VTKLERIVNALQLTLGLSDTNLGTLTALATAPRVQLRGLLSKPELNGRLGVINGRDPESGRYLVLLDGAEAGALPLKVKALNIRGEHGWETRPEALLGILQQVGRALADFDHTYMPPTVYLEIHPDHSTLLDIIVSNGALWQWTNYAEGTGRYGADETLWRRHLRAFTLQRGSPYPHANLREHGCKVPAGVKPSRDVGFIVAFLLATAVETTIFLAHRGIDMRPGSGTIAAPVMRELHFFRDEAREAIATAPITDDAVRAAINTSLETLETTLMNELTAQSNVWLAGDVLEHASRIAGASLASKIVWGHKREVLVMVHLYHALRVGGYLRAIPEVDALLRVFRQSVFFRTEQLPSRGTKGGFRTALALALGATASSIAQGAPELKHGRNIEHTGINPSEFSLVRYVDQFFGAGMDVSQLDLREIAREEVAVLNRAPTLAGALKLMKVLEATRRAKLRESDVTREADEGAAPFAVRADGTEIFAESASARHASVWEQVFPGCSCVPPSPESAVALVFSKYTHVAPVAGLKGAYSSSYTPASERLSREELRQRYKETSARAKGAR